MAATQQFIEIAKALYGPGVDVRELSKMGDMSEVHALGNERATRKRRPRTVPGATVPPAGLICKAHGDDPDRNKKAIAGGLLFGTVAEGAATAQAARHFAQPSDTTVGRHAAPIKVPSALKRIAGSKQGKAAELGLQAVNLGVGLAAARELVKKPKKTSVGKAVVRIPKRDPFKLVATNERARRAGLRLVGVTGGGAVAAGGYVAGSNTRLRRSVDKRVSVEELVTISKVNEEKRQVFGWASLSMVDGEPVIDLQGDTIDIDEVEKAAYGYMLSSRKGGVMHRRIGKFDAGPVHIADVIESVVFTPEKLAAWNLEPDALPLGHWTGFQIHKNAAADEVWEGVKDGTYTGFSIHGSGIRTSVLV